MDRVRNTCSSCGHQADGATKSDSMLNKPEGWLSAYRPTIFSRIRFHSAIASFNCRSNAFDVSGLGLIQIPSFRMCAAIGVDFFSNADGMPKLLEGY